MRKLLFLFVAIIGFIILSSCGSTDSTTNYQISISASPSEGGTVSPSSGQHEEGTSLDISATSSEEYRFVEWQGDYEGTSSSATITVDDDKNIQAIFTKKEYALTVNTEGEGTVDESVLQTTSTTDYESGTIVELTANSAEGWEFIEWKGAITSSENPAQITVDEAKSVTAVFEKKSFDVSVNTEGEGSVTKNPDQESYIFQSNLELEATPSTGYQFVKWQGDIESAENPITVTVDTDPKFTAVFEKENYSLTINTEGEGTVAKDPDQTEFAFNSSVNLTANPADGWKFVEWQGDISVTENPTQITFDEPKEVTAVFEREKNTLAVTSSGDGSVSVIPDKEKYEYNTEVKLLAVANKGSSFIRWEGALSDTKTKGGTLIMTQDYSVKAIFKTYKEALISNLQPSIIIGSRVHEANVSLANTLPAQVQLKKIIVKRGDGSISAEENLTAELIPSNKQISFSLSFGVPPTLNSFNEYTVTWVCEYYEVENDIVVSSGVTTSSNKGTMKRSTFKTIKTIELHADN